MVRVRLMIKFKLTVRFRGRITLEVNVRVMFKVR